MLFFEKKSYMDDDSIAWLRENRIHFLFNDLTEALLRERPQRILDFIEKWCHEARDDACLQNTPSRRESEAAAAKEEMKADPELMAKYLVPGNDYELGEILGTGHYSKVFQAIRNIDKKEVAIKVQPVLGNWTRWEPEALVACQDKGVVELLDCRYDPDGNTLWLVFEIYRDNYEVYHPTDEEDLARTLRQLVESVESMHRHGFVHLDIKPANMLRRAGEHQVVLADFGTAMYLDDPCEQLGDFAFMSPEVYRAEGNYTASNDVWGIGISALCFVQGETPFLGSGFDVEHTFEILEKCRVAPSLNDPTQWSPLFGDFLARCFLAPDMRPTAGELLSHPFLNQKFSKEEER